MSRSFIDLSMKQTGSSYCTNALHVSPVFWRISYASSPITVRVLPVLTVHRELQRESVRYSVTATFSFGVTPRVNYRFHLWGNYLADQLRRHNRCIRVRSDDDPSSFSEGDSVVPSRSLSCCSTIDRNCWRSAVSCSIWSR